MSRRVFLSVFKDEDDILGMAEAARTKGLKIIDIYAPYAVHGLDEAAGFRASRLPIVCFVLALIGATFKVWFEFWTTASNWAINVGGKPWNSLPAFVPVTFEVMVLVAGVGTVLIFLGSDRLLPGRKAKIPFPGVTDDRFVLLIEETDAMFNPGKVRTLCERYHAVHIEEREGEEG